MDAYNLLDAIVENDEMNEVNDIASVEGIIDYANGALDINLSVDVAQIMFDAYNTFLEKRAVGTHFLADAALYNDLGGIEIG